MLNPEQSPIDTQSEAFLNEMGAQNAVRNHRVPGVRTVLVVLSSQGMVYDVDSLRQKILLSYPEAAVFFQTTMGKPLGATSPNHVDLLIDFTGPGQRQSILYARKLRSMAKIAVGRNAGLFRKRIYNRVINEKDPVTAQKLPLESLDRERVVQKEVLSLAGVYLVQAGDALPDRGKSIAIELPPYKKL